MDSWIPCMLGVRVLMSVYWWLVEVHWFTEIDVKSGWTNTRGVEGDWHSSVRINTATSSSCDSYQITSVSAWCLGIVLPLTPSERGWLCLMYIVYHVYSDSILCKRDLFFLKSLCFFIMRFYEAGMLGVCWMYA